MLYLYDNIKYYRKLRGLSQTELALKCGYKDKSAIAKIEGGAVDIPISKIEAIADALEISPNDLLDTPALRRMTIYNDIIVSYAKADDATKQVVKRILDIKDDKSQ